MKNIIILWLVSILCSIQISFATTVFEQWPWKIDKSSTNVLTIENTELWRVLIKPRKTKLVFLWDGMTATQLRQTQNASAVVNAWYFWYANETTRRPFVPAWSYPYSIETKPSNSFCERDKNLCGRIDAHTLRIQTSENPVTRNALNAWPMLLENWRTNTQVIARNSHWLTTNYRTVLINSNNYWSFFFVSTTKRSLLDTSSTIRKIFPNATAINLDGWSSTSWSSSRWWWNQNKVLPTYFVLE